MSFSKVIKKSISIILIVIFISISAYFIIWLTSYYMQPFLFKKPIFTSEYKYSDSEMREKFGEQIRKFASNNNTFPQTINYGAPPNGTIGFVVENKDCYIWVNETSSNSNFNVYIYSKKIFEKQSTTKCVQIIEDFKKDFAEYKPIQ